MIRKELKLILSTFNIRNTQDRYNERKELLRKTIQDEQSDIMCLQEVSFLGESQVDHLVEDDQKRSIYHQYHAESQLKFHIRPGADPESKLDGNTILAKKDFFDEHLTILEDRKMHLSGFRVVHAIKFALKVDPQNYFWVVNVHLHHQVPDWQIRYHQLQNLHLWLYNITKFQSDNIFICGDFNLTPKEEQNYKYFTEMGFKSTYQVVHGQEPVITFPTGLQAPNMDTDPEGCFDYIWFKGNQITPENIHIFGNKHLETDKTIYPSDHMGLSGKFMIKFD
ncbi:hypothetical protein ABPG72_002262 [Tetrahymena utriculariae]